MIKKVLGKTIASAATAGALIAPMALATSPALVNVACTDNPGETTASISLSTRSAVYGTKNFAEVSTAPVPGDPKANASIEVKATERLRTDTFLLRVDTEGHARKLLPRGLAAGDTYEVRARYDSCNWSAPVTYRVSKAQSDPQPTVRHERKAKFRATVSGSGGLDVDAGKVNFILKRRGEGKVGERTDFLNDGVARVNMADLRKRGRYILKVTYAGNRNFEAGSSKIKFRY